MQPNGKPHVLVLHPTSLIIHKAASEPTQGKKKIKSKWKRKNLNINIKGGSPYLQDNLRWNTINK
jgi:hypothetical protein